MKLSPRKVLVSLALPLCACAVGACGSGGPGSEVATEPVSSLNPGNGAFGSRATGNGFTSGASGAESLTSNNPGNGAFQSRQSGNVFTATPAGSSGSGSGTGGSGTGSDGCVSFCKTCAPNASASDLSECALECDAMATENAKGCETQFTALLQCLASAGACDKAAIGASISQGGGSCSQFLIRAANCVDG